MQLIWPVAASASAALDATALSVCYATNRTRPWLRANFVASLDGAAEVAGYSRGLSNEVDQRILRLLRVHADAIMVGAGTIRHEGYGAMHLDDDAQRWRVENGLAAQPTLVIVSNSLALDPVHRLFTQAPVRPIVLTRGAAPAAGVETLAPVADLVRCGDAAVDLSAGLAALRRRGLTQVLTEGGPRLFGDLVAADLVDEICLTVSPLLAGAGATRIAAGVGRAGPAPMRLGHIIAAEDLLLTRYVRADR
jgi:riboflavin biosynthesis pyrimidine reductase